MQEEVRAREEGWRFAWSWDDVYPSDEAAERRERQFPHSAKRRATDIKVEDEI